jgi:hypothetical protein
MGIVVAILRGSAADIHVSVTTIFELAQTGYTELKLVPDQPRYFTARSMRAN